jgi:outer membrane cobalamin receptor
VTAGRLTLDLAGFLRQADDLIDWGRPAAEPDSEPWRTLNIAEATFRGLEGTAHVVLAGQATAAAGRSTTASTGRPVTVTARASLLSFDAEPEAGYVSKYALQPLTRAASLEIAAPVTSRVTFAVRGSASRRADGVTWEVLDARAAAGFGDLAVFADATNLLDASWLDVTGQRAPGRAFSIGARIRR